MAPYSTRAEDRQSAKRPMRKPKSPMRFVTKALPPAVGLLLIRVPEADEQVAAQADALPPDEGEDQAVAQDEVIIAATNRFRYAKKREYPSSSCDMYEAA